MPALLLNTSQTKMRQSYLRQKHYDDQSQFGNTNAIVPLVLAFGFFGLFLIISLWLLFKNKDNSTVPSQQAPASVNPTNQLSNPFQQQAPNLATPQQTPPSNSPFSQKPPQSSPFTTTNPQSLTEEQAKSLVSGWLNFKTKLYADPYDSSSLDLYIIKPGKLYEDITKPGGSIDWLKQKKSYYKFNEVKIKKIIDFKLYQDNAHLTVEVFEDLELMTPSGLDPTQSGKKTQIWAYDLKKNQSDEWRIYDYRKQQ
ncbi:IMS domain-containing protein [Synechococcus sp. AH-603-L18]|nr:IMS domain-containing protein [Synechococcus sp. AH-603-L18]MDB4337886.1 IMS domain-containing protein [Synechococcus sp. AH-603-L18]